MGDISSTPHRSGRQYCENLSEHLNREKRYLISENGRLKQKFCKVRENLANFHPLALIRRIGERKKS